MCNNTNSLRVICHFWLNFPILAVGYFGGQTLDLVSVCVGSDTSPESMLTLKGKAYPRPRLASLSMICTQFIMLLHSFLYWLLRSLDCSILCDRKIPQLHSILMPFKVCFHFAKSKVFSIDTFEFDNNVNFNQIN